MSLLIKLHIVAVSFWLGIVAVESVLERTRAGGREIAFYVARSHFLIDRWIEIPTFLVVVATGALLLDPARLSGWYLLKVVCGLVAVASNIFCAYFVVRRKQAAEAGDLDAVKRQAWAIDLSGLAIPVAMVALFIGLSGLI